MNILILGGTGFISSALVRRLVNRGHRVTTVTRGKHNPVVPDGSTVESLSADRSRRQSLAGALGNRTFDAVFDMIAYTPDQSEMAAGLFRGRVGRFIHCSTVSVYMVARDVQCPVTEDEDSLPLMEYWERNPFGMQYGIDKRECERVLWNAHHDTQFPVSMIRPTFVSGPADPARRDYFWIERILDGEPLLVPGEGDLPFQQVFVEDVAEAFAALLDYPLSIGKAYNVADEEAHTLDEYIAILASLMGRTAELVHVPQRLFDAQPFSRHPRGDVFPFNTQRTATFSLDRIKHDLNYSSTPFREWMGMTIDWWRKQEGHSLGYDARGQELDLIERVKRKAQT